MLDGRPRSCGAAALETTLTRTLNREDLQRALHRTPRLAGNLLELLASRQQHALHYAEDLAFLDVNGRVAARLLRLAARGAAQQGGIDIDLSLTRPSWPVGWRAAVRA